jgi:hypothetical protein
MAAEYVPVAKHKTYYGTLTELDAPAHELRDALKGNPPNRFDPNNNKIVQIFSNHQRIETLKPEDGKRPIIIITAGSPGVGKSTIAKEQFRTFNIDPDLVFTLSVDTLLESSELFCDETSKVYKYVSDKKKERGEEITHENYRILNGIYRNIYKETGENFGIRRKIETLKKKYNNPSSKKLNTTKNSKLGARVQTKPRHAAPAQQRSRSRSQSRQSSRSRSRSPLRKQQSSKGGANHSLNEIREIGFEFGVANGLNILYDCTLQPDGGKITSIMKILQKYATPRMPRYKIKVLLIEAHEDVKKAAEIIQKRIEKRHKEMVEKGFLRSVNPDLKNIEGMIQRNRDGYYKAKELYKDNVNEGILPYVQNDFDFEVIPNP